MRDGWTTVEKGVVSLMDGGIPSSNANVLWVPPACQYNQQSFLELGFAEFQNRTGATVAAGIGARIHRARWQAGQWTEAGGYVDNTANAQSAGANDFTLQTLAINSGFVVASRDTFNVIDILGGTASTGGLIVETISYSGPAGWTAMANQLVMPPSGGTDWAVGENLLWWFEPPDWTPMTVALHGAGVPAGLYGIKVLATTAPTIAGIATSMSIAKVLLGLTNLATSILYSNPPNCAGFKFNCGADALVAVISSKAALNSVFRVNVRTA